MTNASKKTVSYRKAANKKIKSAAIPATVKVKANGVVYSFRVTNISAKAFAGCTKLKKVIIGKNVVSIGKEAFSKAKALKKITIKTTTKCDQGHLQKSEDILWQEKAESIQEAV